MASFIALYLHVTGQTAISHFQFVSHILLKFLISTTSNLELGQGNCLFEQQSWQKRNQHDSVILTPPEQAYADQSAD